MLHPQIHSSHQIGNRYEPRLLIISLLEEVLCDSNVMPSQAIRQPMMLLLLTGQFPVQQQRHPHFEYLLIILLLSSLIVATAGEILAPIMANTINVILKGLWDNPPQKLNIEKHKEWEDNIGIITFFLNDDGHSYNDNFLKLQQQHTETNTMWCTTFQLLVFILNNII